MLRIVTGGESGGEKCNGTDDDATTATTTTIVTSKEFRERNDDSTNRDVATTQRVSSSRHKRVSRNETFATWTRLIESPTSHLYVLGSVLLLRARESRTPVDRSIWSPSRIFRRDGYAPRARRRCGGGESAGLETVARLDDTFEDTALCFLDERRHRDDNRTDNNDNNDDFDDTIEFGESVAKHECSSISATIRAKLFKLLSCRCPTTNDDFACVLVTQRYEHSGLISALNCYANVNLSVRIGLARSLERVREQLRSGTRQRSETGQGPSPCDDSRVADTTTTYADLYDTVMLRAQLDEEADVRRDIIEALRDESCEYLCSLNRVSYWCYRFFRLACRDLKRLIERRLEQSVTTVAGEAVDARLWLLDRWTAEYERCTFFELYEYARTREIEQRLVDEGNLSLVNDSSVDGCNDYDDDECTEAIVELARVIRVTRDALRNLRRRRNETSAGRSTSESSDANVLARIRSMDDARAVVYGLTTVRRMVRHASSLRCDVSALSLRIVLDVETVETDESIARALLAERDEDRVANNDDACANDTRVGPLVTFDGPSSRAIGANLYASRDRSAGRLAEPAWNLRIRRCSEGIASPSLVTRRGSDLNISSDDYMRIYSTSARSRRDFTVVGERMVAAIVDSCANIVFEIARGGDDGNVAAHGEIAEQPRTAAKRRIDSDDGVDRGNPRKIAKIGRDLNELNVRFANMTRTVRSCPLTAVRYSNMRERFERLQTLLAHARYRNDSSVSVVDEVREIENAIANVNVALRCFVNDDENFELPDDANECTR